MKLSISRLSYQEKSIRSGGTLVQALKTTPLSLCRKVVSQMISSAMSGSSTLRNTMPSPRLVLIDLCCLMATGPTACMSSWTTVRRTRLYCSVSYLMPPIFSSLWTLFFSSPISIGMLRLLTLLLVQGVDFNKLEFLEALGSIHQKALKPSTILSAFRETGLIPYRSKKVVDRLREKKEERQKDTELRRPATPPVQPQAIKPMFTTPLTIQTFKQRLSNYIDPETPAYPEDLRKIAKATITWATENIILKDELRYTKAAEVA